MNSQETDHFESTISTSKEASIAKAVEIMMHDIKSRQIKQEITRPKVSLLKGLIPIIAFAVSYIILIVNLSTVSNFLSVGSTLSFWIITLLYIAILCLCMKRMLIWAILIYQKYAPEKIRKLCCFEPSCSEYMKLSIQKYGVFKGVYKGLCRLSRCHWPNGGTDYP